MINKLLGGLFGKVVENAEGILDEVITTDEEREKFDTMGKFDSVGEV